MTAEEGARSVVARLQQAGHEAYWVGGCVRDLRLGCAPKDYDIATSARPPEVQALFPRNRAVGRQFGVVLVAAGRRWFEVATFRAEAEYEDGRRPRQVTFAHAKADATRRDFTINGMFYDPIAGALHDWVEGERDLGARVLRTIGPPRARFEEDHLRLLRAVRFAAQLDFEVEAVTWSAIREQAALIRRISAERVRDELIKIFRPPHAARGLDLLRDSGLLAEVLPELAATITCAQSPEYHPEGTVYEHLRRMLSQLPADAAADLPWAVLLHDIAKPVTAARAADGERITFHGHESIGAEMAQEMMRRLRFPRRRIEDVVTCVRFHMQFKDVAQMRRSTVRRILLRPTFPLELELHRLDCLGSHGQLDAYELLRAHQREWEAQPALIPPLVSGHDLIAVGYQPGRALGRLLAEIREKQLQEELRTREEALVWAQERLRKRASQIAVDTRGGLT